MTHQARELAFEEPFLRTDLPRGSLVIERYVYTNRNGKDGVQWLAEVVADDGLLLLLQACKTRREALEVAGRV